jgi:hypothetical protein
MYIEAVPNRGSPPAILLRESYREAGKVKKRTLLNLSDWPHERIAGLKTLLKGGTVIPKDQDAITIIRSLPHGHVDAVLGTARKIGLDRVLGPDSNRCRDLILALVVSRILDPGSKLAAARALSPDTATSSLGEQLALGVVDEDELYSALDWLAVRQPAIEAALAKRHFTGGTLVLYDVSSSYLEGRCCPLAQFGYSRDGKRGKLQIVYGLLCAPDGCPVAIEVFSGSTADPTTLTSQVTKLKERFGLDHVVLVGDRGMITQARITEDLKAAGLDWITALRAPAIKALLDGGALQMSLFDDRDMAGITSPEFPGERLIVCRNRALAGERARKRADLLAATERDLARIAAAVARKRQPLRGKAEIGLAIGAVLDKHKMAKHFTLDITDTRFSFARKTDEITVEAALDGLYVVRTSLPAGALDDNSCHSAQLQIPKPGRARLPLHQDGRSPDQASLSLAGRSRACPRVSLHARLLPGMAYAPASGAHALRRHRQGRRRSPTLQRRRQSRALPRRRHQANHRPNRGRPAGPQLPNPSRRSRHPHPKHPGDRHRPRATLHLDRPADPRPTTGPRPPRALAYPVDTLASV